MAVLNNMEKTQGRDPVISIFHHKHGTSVSIVQEESSADFWENVDNHDRNNADEYIEDVPLPPLFAAAPALLAALNECRDCLVAIWDSNTLGPTGRQLLTAATAAIDKAVGKTNEKAPNP